MNHRHIFFFDPVQIQREQIGSEALWHVIFKAGGRIAFIGAQNPAAAFFADIPFCISIAQNRVFRVILTVFDQHRVRFGDDILVFHRNGRALDSQQTRSALGVIARGGHNMLGCDLELFFRWDKVAALFHHPGTRHDPFAAGPSIAIYLHAAHDLGTVLARALGHGLGHIGGVYIAICRVIQRALQVFSAHQGPAVLDLGGSHPFIRNAHRFRCAGI